MTTKTEISEWFDRGVKQGATHMIVAVDTFDYGDFPVYVEVGQDVRTVEKRYNSSENMLRVIEVYNLTLDKTKQLNGQRSFNY